MSLIVALRYKEGIIVAGDSQYTTGNIKRNSINEFKIFETLDDDKYKFAIGVTGCGRDRDILQYQVQYIIDKNDDTILEDDKLDKSYLVSKFIPRLRKIMKENDRLEENNSIMRSSLVICDKESIFIIYPDFSVLEFYSFCVNGSGEQLVEGYLNSLNDSNRKFFTHLSFEEAETIMHNCFTNVCKSELYINDNYKIINLN